ncbi:hypothetical protein CLAIMM_02479 [Cladophialophora immunda]|nr:hypothetical protein CLAIMM_02479 [Cladophialophora immunda]
MSQVRISSPKESPRTGELGVGPKYVLTMTLSTTILPTLALASSMLSMSTPRRRLKHRSAPTVTDTPAPEVKAGSKHKATTGTKKAASKNLAAAAKPKANTATMEHP